MIDELRASFARAHFADVTAIVTQADHENIRAEVTAALDTHAVRRDLRIAATGNSPRRYSVAGRDALVAACPATAALYRSPQLLETLSFIAGEALEPVPYAPEELIATRLEFAGDTHGWHWDDYGFALVWVLEAPAQGDGAALEYVANVAWCKSAPRVDGILAEREPVRANVAAGTVYLLRTDTTLHRITPLRHDGRRDALCFSYAAARERSYDHSHETLDAILSG